MLGMRGTRARRPFFRGVADAVPRRCRWRACLGLEGCVRDGDSCATNPAAPQPGPRASNVASAQRRAPRSTTQRARAHAPVVDAAATRRAPRGAAERGAAGRNRAAPVAADCALQLTAEMRALLNDAAIVREAVRYARAPLPRARACGRVLAQNTSLLWMDEPLPRCRG